MTFRGAYKEWMKGVEGDENAPLKGSSLPKATLWRYKKTGILETSPQEVQCENCHDNPMSESCSNHHSPQEQLDMDPALGSDGDPVDYSEPLEEFFLQDFSFEDEPQGDKSFRNVSYLIDTSAIQNHTHAMFFIFTKDDDIHRPLYDGACISLGQAVVLIMSYTLMNGVSMNGLDCLLQLMQALLPVGNILPNTLYLFRKHFKKRESGLKQVFFCQSCEEILQYDRVLCSLKCSTCETSFTRSQLWNKGAFFLAFPLHRLIRRVLQQYPDFILGKRSRKPEGMQDIIHGEQYNVSPPDISLTVNCDGVPVFKSSKKSLWPIQVMINELPPLLRVQNILLCGLWLGEGQPCMKIYLGYFVRAVESLKAISWQYGCNLIKSKVIPYICTVDTVARAKIMNMKSFHAEYGCPWCYLPGKRLEKGHGTMNSYSGTELSKRKNSEVRIFARKSTPEEPIYGIKGPSPMSLWPSFDMVNGFVVDALHCVDLGVMRQLITLWMESKKKFFRNKECDIAEINKKLLNFRVPRSINRRPRTLDERAFWKGNEYRSFLFFYGPVVLKDHLQHKYFSHFLKLSSAIFSLYQESISFLQLKLSELALKSFVTEFGSLYGEMNVTFNVHQLLHIGDSAYNWGPLWGFSTYPFESLNGILMKLFHGTQHVPLQISKRFLILNDIIGLVSEVMENASERTHKALSKVLDSYSDRKYATRVGISVVLGKTHITDVTDEEKVHIQSIVAPGFEAAFQAKKLLVNGILFTSKGCQSSFHKQNYYCHGPNGPIEILRILKLHYPNTSPCVVILARELKVKKFQFNEIQMPHIHICEPGPMLSLLPSQLGRKCLSYQESGKVILCDMPLLKFIDN